MHASDPYGTANEASCGTDLSNQLELCDASKAFFEDGAQHEDLVARLVRLGRTPVSETRLGWLIKSLLGHRPPREPSCEQDSEGRMAQTWKINPSYCLKPARSLLRWTVSEDSFQSGNLLKITFLITLFMGGLGTLNHSFIEEENGYPLDLSSANSHIDLEPLTHVEGCALIPQVVETFQLRHINPNLSEIELRERLVSAYASRLDPEKVLLTQPKHDVLKAELAQVVDKAQKGDCSGLDSVSKRRKTWQREMTQFVRGYLATPKLTLDRKLAFQMDHRKRPRPTNEEEQSLARSALVQFQLARYIRAGLSLTKAKRQLSSYYARLEADVSRNEEGANYGFFLRIFGSVLDPHSNYLSKQEVEQFRIDFRLSLVGIGAVIKEKDGFPIIQRLIKGGPAALDQRLKKDDRIVSIRELPSGVTKKVQGLRLADIADLVRGARGSRVLFTVQRNQPNGSPIRLEIELRRDKVKLDEKKAKLSWYTPKRGGQTIRIAVIELESFYEGSGFHNDCVAHVRRLLKQAERENADGVILELSNNGGGLLRAAVEMAGLFMAEGPMVGIRGRDGITVPLNDDDSKIQYAGPLAVLISRGSASASEVVAAAIKDYSRGVIIGDERTYGKGTVQSVVDLPSNHGALKVTTHMFFGPGGSSTQTRGVASDVLVPSRHAAKTFTADASPYGLPWRSVTPFRGDEVNGDDPLYWASIKQWAPITENEIEYLKSRSKSRLKHSAAFEGIRRKLREKYDGSGLITIEQFISSVSPGVSLLPAAQRKRYELPRHVEAAEVLADLVMLRGQATVKDD